LTSIDNKFGAELARNGQFLKGILRGIEKEGLRVALDNSVSQTSHPQALGSTLTHPSITTDYSEALLEFISPKMIGVEESIDYLTKLHGYTLRNLREEVIWPASMPCRLNGDESILIADYGSSNIGQMKHVYRQGLGLRYGRIMQSIAGIHYNFSLPQEFWSAYREHLGCSDSLQDFQSEQYFSLIRNFRRYSWILLYLYGASPVLDRSFLNGRDHALKAFSQQTLGLPYATSLRMSDLGYQNSAQEELRVSYNSLQDYITTLSNAMRVTYPEYERIGTKADGQYVQLNTNILQLENEYYSDIRPKRVTNSGEKPIAALRDRGVEYIEVRILDINPFLAEGIDSEQIRFLDAFLLHCLLSPCPEQSITGCKEVNGNKRSVLLNGRDPELTLLQDGKSVPLQNAADDLLNGVEATAKLLDQANELDAYGKAVAIARKKITNPTLTPSGKVMNLVQAGGEFVDFTRQQADQHRQYFTSLNIDPVTDAELQSIAADSLERQRLLEASDELTFDQFLAAYNS